MQDPLVYKAPSWRKALIALAGILLIGLAAATFIGIFHPYRVPLSPRNSDVLNLEIAADNRASEEMGYSTPAALGFFLLVLGILGLLPLFMPRYTLTADANGITITTADGVHIPWTSIRDIRVESRNVTATNPLKVSWVRIDYLKDGKETAELIPGAVLPVRVKTAVAALQTYKATLDSSSLQRYYG
jgi:hypothetical protein